MYKLKPGDYVRVIDSPEGAENCFPVGSIHKVINSNRYNIGLECQDLDEGFIDVSQFDEVDDWYTAFDDIRSGNQCEWHADHFVKCYKYRLKRVPLHTKVEHGTT